MAGAVRIVMIGLGKWSHQLAQAIQRSNSAELVACYSRTPQKRRAFAQMYDCAEGATLTETLNSANADAVMIATPAHSHAELTLTCARQGLHVFVEKPMALSVADALQMIRICEENGVVLMVGHEMRRLGSMRAIKELLLEEVLGPVVSATAGMTLTGTFQPDNWRCHRDTNRGGALMQLGIHQIENLNYLLGTPVRVQGALANARAPGGVDDVGVAVITYESGTQAVVSANYISPSTFHLALNGERASLYQIAEMRVWPNAAAVDRHTQLILQTPEESRKVAMEPTDVLLEQTEDFARSVRQRVAPETGAREGLMALAVVEAALRSFQDSASLDPQTLLSESIADD